MRRRSERAQAMTEMAMLAPMIFLLFIFVFDLARAAATWAAIAEAVREGARTSVTMNTTTGQGYAANDSRIIANAEIFGPNLTLSAISGCYHGYSSGNATPAPTTGNSGYIYIMPSGTSTYNAPQGQAVVAPAETVNAACNAVNIAPYGTYPLKIVIAYNFQPFTPFASTFMPNGITMLASSTMYTEY